MLYSLGSPSIPLYIGGVKDDEAILYVSSSWGSNKSNIGLDIGLFIYHLKPRCYVKDVDSDC